MPQAPTASDDEVLHFIERRRPMGLGIGYVDAHLRAAAALGPGVRLWTRDRRLAAAARRLGLDAQFAGAGQASRSALRRYSADCISLRRLTVRANSNCPSPSW